MGQLTSLLRDLLARRVAAESGDDADGARRRHVEELVIGAIRHAARARGAAVEPAGDLDRRLDDLGEEIDVVALAEAHEALLELRAAGDGDGTTLRRAPGNDRKTSGSYYTPPALVDLVLDEALEPFLDRSVERGRDLTELALCDPACGAGYFLTAALRRLMARLPSSRRAAAARVVHGVDVNPVAVALTRFALWCEAGDPTLPLDAFDDQVRRGDALLSPPAEVVAAGLPDVVFARRDDDDRAALRRARNRNRRERDAGRLADDRATRDAWCAAFYRAPGELPPTTGELGTAERRFFHWDLEFPGVFARGGFDVILGNPPWEKLTLSEEEWFAGRAPAVATTRGKARRAEVIEALAASDPDVYRAWHAARRAVDSTKRLLSRDAGLYPLTGAGEQNTYMLFTELASRLVAAGGRVGLIVKTGIASANNALPFFRSLCRDRRLVSLHDFVNQRAIFPHVQTVERFSVLTFTGSAGHGAPARFTSLCHEPDDARSGARLYTLEPDDISRMSPTNGAAPLLRGPREATVMRRLYRDHTTLGARADDGATAWNARCVHLLHMSNDSSWFVRREEIDRAGVLHPDGSAELDGARLLPLIEGKMLSHWEPRYGSFHTVPPAERYGRKCTAPTPSESELADPGFRPEPRYWVPETLWDERRARRGLRTDWLFCFRDVVGAWPDVRTATGAFVAAGPAGDSAPILALDPLGDEREDARRALLLATIFNSLAFDWIVRQKLYSKHLKFNTLGQIAIPTPAAVLGHGAAERLLENALELSFTAQALTPLGRALGRAGPSARDPARRLSLMRANDVHVARLYGLDDDELRFVVRSFDTLERQEKRRHGRFVSLELIERHLDTGETAHARGA